MKLLSVAPDTVTSAVVKSLVVPLAVKVNVSALSLDVEPLATAPEPFAAVIVTVGAALLVTLCPAKPTMRLPAASCKSLVPGAV